MKSKKKIIVYRDKLLLNSETFIPRSYDNFRKYEVIYACSKLGWSHKKITNNKILICNNFFFRFLFIHFGYIQNLNLIKSYKAEAIHAHFGKSGAIALPLAKKLNIPLIITFHGGDVTKKKHFKRKLFGNVFKRRLKELKNYTSLFLGVSNFISSRLIQEGFPKNKVLTHYNGVYLKNEDREVQRKNNLLFVGRLVEKKGIEVLIDAIKILNKKEYSISLDIVGTGLLEKKLKKIAGNTKNINFLGWKLETEVWELMKQCYALVMPSKTASNGDSEGLPTVILEAIKLRTLVIASNHSGIPEVILNEKTGLIFKESDSYELSQQIIKALNYKEIEKEIIKKNATKILNEKFDSMKQSQKLETYINEIIETKKW